MPAEDRPAGRRPLDAHLPQPGERRAVGRGPSRRTAAPYTPVSGPVLSLMRSTFTPTFSSNVSPRFMNGVCRS